MTEAQASRLQLRIVHPTQASETLTLQWITFDVREAAKYLREPHHVIKPERQLGL